jgi:hypothetical protein
MNGFTSNQAPLGRLVRRLLSPGQVIALVVLAGILPAASANAQSPAVTWVEKAPMPVAVSAFGYAVLGDKICVIGGNSGGVDTTAVPRYKRLCDGLFGQRL